ncbi:hypothetical protein [Actinoplanes rectilineatus]|uniref:hypothetical protein n=1 Tax=Actinoplanes rectilineatus TaxID=113571 RepID=UPI0005F28372|nr:hypothetical protein [Actinoplanes rectilineatus]
MTSQALIWEKVPFGGCVYMLAFSDGTVKVGKTGHLAQRFKSIVNFQLKTFGVRLIDFYFTRTHDSYSATEDLAIRAAEQSMTAESKRLTKEWFFNLDRELLQTLLVEMDPTDAYASEPVRPTA